MFLQLTSQYMAMIYLLILRGYSRDDSVKTSLKYQYFQRLINVSLFSVSIFLVCLFIRDSWRAVPESILQITHILDYLGRTYLSLAMLAYFMTVIYENETQLKHHLRVISLPFYLFSLVVLANPLTGWFFRFLPGTGYAFGPAYYSAFVVATMYNLAILVVVNVNLQGIERSRRWVFLSFPLISFLVIGLQILLPALRLHGLASSISLLLIYLYLQNKKMELDELTGLQNRKSFLNRLLFHMQHQTGLGIVLVSLDHFKTFNSQYGQHQGDELLQAIGQYLVQTTRSNQVFRFAGDEFAVMVDSSTGWLAADLSDTISKRIHRPWSIRQTAYHIRASVALVMVQYPTSSREIIDLLEYCIDLAKQAGNGQVVFANEKIIAQHRRQRQIVDIMKRALLQHASNVKSVALRTGDAPAVPPAVAAPVQAAADPGTGPVASPVAGFSVYYQPVYSLARQRFVSAEALLRLSDLELGAISPAEFIPIAEKTGLIIEIGYLVLDETCRLIRELTGQGLAFEHISVNLSALQLLDSQLTTRILAMIASYQIDTSRLCIEITESAFIDNYEYALKLIENLRSQGIRFYLDDYGTGYSNLETVIELQLDYLKIDKSILYNAIRSDKHFGLMAGLVSIFSDFGIKVVIEGVENNIHRAIVERSKADLIQGFLLARPVPSGQLERHFASQSG